jgi:hypothetical protein
MRQFTTPLETMVVEPTQGDWTRYMHFMKTKILKPGVSKRCRISWLTNEPKFGERGGVEGSQPMSKAVHRSLNKLGRCFQGFAIDDMLAAI